MSTVERRFNPDQPRDVDGRWTDGLADRISLGARERLVSSKRFKAGRGSYRSFDDVNATAAVVEGPRGREVRLGIVATVDDGAEKWDADVGRDDTVALNRRGLRRLRNDLADAAGKAKQAGDDSEDLVAEGDAGGVRWSVYLEDDGSYSANVGVGDGDTLTLDAKQLDRFLAYLDGLDGQLEATRSHGGGRMRVVERRFNPSQPRDRHGQWTDSPGGLLSPAQLSKVDKLVADLPAPAQAAGREFAAAIRDGDRGRIGQAAANLIDSLPTGHPAVARVVSTMKSVDTAHNRRFIAESLGREALPGLTVDELGQLEKRLGKKIRSTTTSDLPRLNRLLAEIRATRRSRLDRGIVVPGFFDRTYPLDDIQIQRSGDGRTVEAYAAMFDRPYEVRDEHGHYMEIINRSAFNRTLNGAGRNAMCLYNHGRNLEGQPDSMASIPLGTPLEIRPDGRGLLTVTRYNRGPYTDQVLEAIRNGDIKAQSFRGRIVRSDPSGRIRRRVGAPLPTVTRHELGLTDYGPTPIPVNTDAEIVAVRSVQDLIEELRELDADEREELLRSLNLELSTHDGDTTGDPDDEGDEDLDDDDDEDEPATPDGSGPGAEDPPAERSAVHSGRQADLARRIRVALLTRSMG